MIKEGQMTLIEATPYNCVKIAGSVAFLQRVGEDKRGRFKKMDVKLVPYVDENNQIVIPKPPPMNRKKMTRFHFMKVIKDEIELPVSHDLAYFVAEQLESFVSQLAICAEKNARELGHKRSQAPGRRAREDSEGTPSPGPTPSADCGHGHCC